jgi:signal transduction histidine kinase
MIRDAMAGKPESHPFADLLARRKREIETRWRERVGTEADESAVLSDYLEGLRQVWIENAVTRGRSFDVHAVVHQLEILREVILEVAIEEGETDQQEIMRALDVPIEATVDDYVRARDREAKRSEAEHICFITHELRNPLAVATLAAAQLRRMGLSSPVQKRAAELIERSLQRLRTLIEGAAPVEPWRA